TAVPASVSSTPQRTMLMRSSMRHVCRGLHGEWSPVRSLASCVAMAMPETLHKLLTAAGPSGYEQAPAAVFREAAGAFAEVTQDSVGSTVARVAGTGDGRSVAIVGHIDEVGLIVHHV